MFVVIDEGDVVQSISLIPGNKFKMPETWHGYFPVGGNIPNEGSVFVPDKSNGSWLFVDEACTLLSEKDRINKLRQQRDH